CDFIGAELLSDYDGHGIAGIIAKHLTVSETIHGTIASCLSQSTSPPTPATKPTNVRAISLSMRISTRLQRSKTVGMSRRRCISGCVLRRARGTSSDIPNRKTSGHYRAGSMAMSLARPGIELVPVDADVIRRAEQEIESCKHCHPDDAEIPFDWILRELTGKHGPCEFMLTEPARCPNCGQPITEKTLVEPKEN